MDVTPELPTPERVRDSRIAPGLRSRIGTVTLLVSQPPDARPNRVRAAGSRRALVVGVVVFLTIQFGLNLAVRRDWLPLRDPVYAEKIELLRPHDRFFDGSPSGTGRPTRVLALGSSRTQLGFDAGRFTRAVPQADAFNFGCPAAGPMTAALYFRRLLDAGAVPDVLLIEVHPGFLTPMDPPFEARWLHAYRLTPAEVDVLHDNAWAVAPPEHHGWQGWVAAAHAFKLPILNRYVPTLVPCPFGLTVGARSDGRGYVAGIEIEPRERPRSVARTFEQYAPVFPGYHVGGPGPAAIRDTLRLAADHGIRTAVVLMPESSEFRGWYGPAGTAAIDGFVRTLGVRVFDARGWVPDDGFADGHHLTPGGGAAFTDRLAAEAAPWIGK
jgi:hypothetical protein